MSGIQVIYKKYSVPKVREYNQETSRSQTHQRHSGEETQNSATWQQETMQVKIPALSFSARWLKTRKNTKNKD